MAALTDARYRYSRNELRLRKWHPLINKIICVTSSVKRISQLRIDYDTTTMRQYHDAFEYDGSDRNYDLRSIRLRHDYDEKLTCSFFARVESRQMEAGARDKS